MKRDVPAEPTEQDPPSSTNRRAQGRVAVTWAVDCRTRETFLYASITNISTMGIFVRTERPLPVGTRVTLSFTPRAGDVALAVEGVVQWTNPMRALGDNPNPGMGVQFERLTREEREQLVDAIHTIAYVRED